MFLNNGWYGVARYMPWIIRWFKLHLIFDSFRFDRHVLDLLSLPYYIAFVHPECLHSIVIPSSFSHSPFNLIYHRNGLDCRREYYYFFFIGYEIARRHGMNKLYWQISHIFLANENPYPYLKGFSTDFHHILFDFPMEKFCKKDCLEKKMLKCFFFIHQEFRPMGLHAKEQIVSIRKYFFFSI